MRIPLVLGLLLAVGGVAVAAWLAFSGPGDGLPDTPPEWTDEGGGVAAAKTPGHEVVAGRSWTRRALWSSRRHPA